jgi:hypothetical protein
MPKKIIKTTEELTEEFFARERTEYEKRVPAAFPRLPVAKFTELTELPDVEDSPPEPEPEPEPEPPEVELEELPLVKPGLKA